MTNGNGQPVSLIRCQDLWKVYRLGDVEVQALRGLNLTIEQGEFVAIKIGRAHV